MVAHDCVRSGESYSVWIQVGVLTLLPIVVAVVQLELGAGCVWHWQSEAQTGEAAQARLRSELRTVSSHQVVGLLKSLTV